MMPIDPRQIKETAKKYAKESNGITLKEMVWWLVDKREEATNDIKVLNIAVSKNSTGIMYLKWIVGFVLTGLVGAWVYMFAR